MATNEEIVKEIERDPHRSLTEIARSLSIEPQTIHYRRKASARGSAKVERAYQYWKSLQKTRTVKIDFRTDEETAACLGPNPSEESRKIVEAECKRRMRRKRKE